MKLGRCFFLYNKQWKNINGTIFCPCSVTHGPKIFIASALYVHPNSDVLVNSASVVNKKNDTLEISFVMTNHTVLKKVIFQCR